MESVALSGGRRGLWRSRWAAIGAAVGVTLGGGGMALVNAAASPRSSVVTIDPVRILDTRTDLGLAGPFVSAVSQKLQVTGAAVPAGATGVLLNVTVVTPTANGFLSIRPGDASGAASTSSLNFEAGDVVPNSVQVGLPTAGPNAGKIDITYDAYGVAGPTTEVLIDVVGYMAGADSYSKAEVDALLAATNSYSKAQVDALLAAKVNKPSGSSTITVPSAAFSVGNSALALEFDPGFSSWNNNGTVEGCVVAPLLLPAGVTVTSMTAGFYGGGSAISLKLYKMLNGSNLVATEMASAATTGASLSYEVTDSTITSPVIDLSTNRYHLSVCLSAGGSEFDYAKIAFTFPP